MKDPPHLFTQHPNRTTENITWWKAQALINTICHLMDLLCNRFLLLWRARARVQARCKRLRIFFRGGRENKSTWKTNDTPDWLLLRVALSRVGTSQDVPQSCRGDNIFKYFNGVNQFQNQFSRIWNRFKPEDSGFFEYFALKTSLKTGFIYLKLVYTRKYSKM